MRLPESIIICEVGLRDGLQNEERILSTEQKIKLLRCLVAAGVRSIEIGSLVNPKRVPSMADTEDLFRLSPAEMGVDYRVLVLNQRGIERAVSAGIERAKIVLSASETHQQKNAGCTKSEMLHQFVSMSNYAISHDLKLTGAIATAFGCPYEGEVPLESLYPIVEAFCSIGIEELSLSDTTGTANPRQVYDYCIAMQRLYPKVVWNMHFHDTRGMGLANVLAAMQAGVGRFDASLGGLGGCPFAPGASGNIATEDLVHMCQEMGVSTSIELDSLMDSAILLQDFVGKRLASSLLRVGRSSNAVNS